MQSKIDSEEKMPENPSDNETELGCAVERLEIALQGVMRINETRSYAPVSLSSAIEAAFSTFEGEYEDYCRENNEILKGEQLQKSAKNTAVLGCLTELVSAFQALQGSIEEAAKNLKRRHAKKISGELNNGLGKTGRGIAKLMDFLK
jgi:hypothetical protein